MWGRLGVLLIFGLLAGACGDDGDAADGDDAVAVAQQLAERLDQEAIETDEVFQPLFASLEPPVTVEWFVEFCTSVGPIRQATYDDLVGIEAPDELPSWDAYIEAKAAWVEASNGICEELTDDPSEAEAAYAEGVDVFEFIEPTTRPPQDADFAACLDLQAEVGAITDLVLNCDGIPPGE